MTLFMFITAFLPALTPSDKGIAGRLFFVTIVGLIVFLLEKREKHQEIKRLTDVDRENEETISQFIIADLKTITRTGSCPFKIDLSTLDPIFEACADIYCKEYNAIINTFNETNDKIYRLVRTQLTPDEKKSFLQEHLPDLKALREELNARESDLNNYISLVNEINAIIMRFFETKRPYIQTADELGLKTDIGTLNPCFAPCKNQYAIDYNTLLQQYNNLLDQINHIITSPMPAKQKNEFINEKLAVLEIFISQKSSIAQGIQTLISTINSIDNLITNYYGLPIKEEPKPADYSSVRISKSIKHLEINAQVSNIKGDRTRIIDEYNEINKSITSVLAVPYPTEQKYSYLNSQSETLNNSASERKRLYSEFQKSRRMRVRLKQNGACDIIGIKKAFAAVNVSKKYLFHNIFIRSSAPESFATTFESTEIPFVATIGDMTYCFFSCTILMFNTNGEFITAIVPSALKITVKKMRETIDIYDRTANRLHTDSDSECVDYGTTITSWKYVKKNGQPDLRYKDNPEIRRCYNSYEYATITFKIANTIATCTTSSQEAIKLFDDICTDESNGGILRIFSKSS